MRARDLCPFAVLAVACLDHEPPIASQAAASPIAATAPPQAPADGGSSEPPVPPAAAGEPASFAGFRACKPVAPTDGGVPGQVNGWLEPSVIQAIVRRNFAYFRSCYEHGLQRDPNLAGQISTKFVIGLDGHVEHSELEASDLPDPEVVQCLVEGFTRVVFPPPKCDGRVTVVYPIQFNPR